MANGELPTGVALELDDGTRWPVDDLRRVPGNDRGCATWVGYAPAHLLKRARHVHVAMLPAKTVIQIVAE